MVQFQKHKVANILTLTLIIMHGIFRKWMLAFYSEKLIDLLNLFGYSITEVKSWFVRNGLLAQEQQWSDFKIGYFIYYPIYFALHLLFIYFLFRKNKKVRNWLLISVSIVVISTRLIVIFANNNDWSVLAAMGGRLFNNLLGLPFILLFVEGGKILYQDIIKLTEKKNNSESSGIDD